MSSSHLTNNLNATMRRREVVQSQEWTQARLSAIGAPGAVEATLPVPTPKPSNDTDSDFVPVDELIESQELEMDENGNFVAETEDLFTAARHLYLLRNRTLPNVELEEVITHEYSYTYVPYIHDPKNPARLIALPRVTRPVPPEVDGYMYLTSDLTVTIVSKVTTVIRNR